MPDYSYIAWILFLPLGSFLILGLFGQRWLKRSAGILGTLCLLVVAGLSLYAIFTVHTPVIAFRYPWLPFYPGMAIEVSVILDPISLMMIGIVSFVSLMVHVFSLGYMKGERRYATYYSFLSLFTFSMLGLVLSGNLFLTYIFWEGVGVSSFLLIGFWFDRPTAVAAAKKAFIVTRFADLGFLVGILILSFNTGTLDIGTLIGRLTPGSPAFVQMADASFLGVSVLTWGLSLVFIGGAGKSAMFPLHIWLPDAMEGPTPVSALIHAATMVVAGVYLVARLFTVFSHAGPAPLELVAYVGALSALVAAVIACTQTDIKRVLAYSTMSQIGYMMFALGVSAYSASMFHLFTHAFFKSLLFLGAGTIIHFVHSNELRDMGGLRRRMPVTHVCFLIACLAISGIPPFAGFFSKEEILLGAWHANKLIYATGFLVSGLTAFYMFRLYFSIFWNHPAHEGSPVHQHAPAHEHASAHHHPPAHTDGTLTMRLPMIILACCSIVAGFAPFSRLVPSPDGAPAAEQPSLAFSIGPVLLALAGIGLAWSLYGKKNDRPTRIARAFGALYAAAYRKFYIDELWLFITKRVFFNCIGRPAAWIDRNIVDGVMNGLASATAGFSAAIKGVQSGKVQSYALWFLAGIAGLVILFIYIWK
jgi:NADH-quinone oxidoreductase subunit L